MRATALLFTWILDMNQLNQRIAEVLASHAGMRLNGKIASARTQVLSHECIYNFFNTLTAAGFKVQNPVNVGERHVEIVVRIWWHERKISAKTLQDYLSRVRIFFGWLGKPGLVGKAGKYLPDVDPADLKVKVAARASKSWSANEVDVIAKLHKARMYDFRFGLMLLMQLTFGLRRKEVLLCRPWIADRGTSLRVFPSEAKGGRPRDIPIQTEFQRKVLQLVQSHIGKTKALAWESMSDGKVASFDQKVTRYKNSMAEIGFTKAEMGVTGHGLRAQYAENMALLEGFVPPTLGGSKDQLPPEELDVKRVQVSEALGHSRLEITSAYYGSLRSAGPAISSQELSKLIQNAAALMTEENLSAPLDMGIYADCNAIVQELNLHQIYLNLPQVYALWRNHSSRMAVEWVKPQGGIKQAIEAAARQVMKAKGDKTSMPQAEVGL